MNVSKDIIIELHKDKFEILIEDGVWWFDVWKKSYNVATTIKIYNPWICSNDEYEIARFGKDWRRSVNAREKNNYKNESFFD